ncbi:DsbA family protein [Streptomyces sp. NPDC058613]|uniref:DsbA family protein n=1 Tax=Streptomyces sp. NPDC058613 TaxID=3346556 RepID=UPI003652DDB7
MARVRKAGRAGRAVVAVAVAALLGGAVAGCGGGGADAEADPDAAFAVRTSPFADRLAKLPARVEGGTVVVGATDAPHTVRVLVDPHCGYCAKFERTGGEALLKLAGDGGLKVEYVLVSFLDERGSGSGIAVNALRASVDKGKFAEYQAALFASQPKGRFTDELLLRIADGVPGLRGAGDFDKAVAEQTYKAWVGEAAEAFRATGARGTPQVLLDGKPLPARAAGSIFDGAALAAALKEAGVGG